MSGKIISNGLSISSVYDGQDGVAYEVRPNISTIRLAYGASGQTQQITVACFKKEGGKVPTQQSSCWAAYLWNGAQYEFKDGTSTPSTAQKQLNITGISTSWRSVVIYATADDPGTGSTPPTNYYAKFDVTIIVNGQQGTPGTNGVNGVTYEVRPNISTIRLSYGASGVTQSITCALFKKEGDSAPTQESCYWSAYLKNGTSYTYVTGTSSASSAQQTLVITGISTTYQSVVIFATTSSAGNTPPTSYLAKSDVVIVVNGQKGDQGNQGAQGNRGYTIRGPRLWRISQSEYYLSGAAGEQYLDIVWYNNKIYMCNTTHIPTSTALAPGVSAYWTESTSFDFVATELLLAATAMIERIFAGGIVVGTMGSNQGMWVKITKDDGFVIGYNDKKCVAFEPDGGSVALRFYDTTNGKCAGQIDDKFFVTAGKDNTWTKQGTLAKLTTSATTPAGLGNGLWSQISYITSGSDYYSFSEGYTISGTGEKVYNIGQGTDKSVPSVYNGRYFNQSSGTPIPANQLNGWYTRVNNGAHMQDQGDYRYNERLYYYVDGSLSNTCIYYSDGTYAIR